MHSELTRLFSKSFVIGFVLPAVALIMAAGAVCYAFGLEVPLPTIIQGPETDALRVTVGFFVIWLVAATLMALNWPITRFLEGYGTLNPFRIQSAVWKKVYRKLRHKIEDYRQELDQAKTQGRTLEAKEAQKNYGNALWQMARDFPDDEALVLPTKFGNAMRAFEVYSRIIYGLESIYAWTRLLAVIPSEYREMIDNEKAQMDFWINLWFGSCLTIAVYTAFAVSRSTVPAPWIPFVALLIAFVAAKSAKVVAITWGTFVTSAIDLYRGELCRKLGFQLPASIEQERQFWQTLSQVWVYRSRDIVERLDNYRLTEFQNDSD